MKDLKRENTRLRRLVAHLSLVVYVLANVAAEKLFSIRGSRVNFREGASWRSA